MDIRNYFGRKRSRLEETSNLPRISSSTNTVDAQVDSQSESNSVKVLSTSTVSMNELEDLLKKGEPIKQTVLTQYPKTKDRSFQALWFHEYKWLMYSVEKDAAFCYACMQFKPSGMKDVAYTSSGFKNWKNAKDAKRGFPRHEKTGSHVEAMIMWEEKKNRQTSNTEISTLVNDKTLEKHRYYLKSIFEVVQFLVINELSFRGSYDIDEKAERGLFIKLFEFALKKDRFLAECNETIPNNGKYTSPEIQNEIIQIMAESVRESVVIDVMKSDVPWFTLMEDGTKDKNNRENIAIAIRYVKEGKPRESLLNIITTKELDAKTFTEKTIETLRENSIDLSRLLSQCYDGANVMSGKKGGVSGLLEQHLNRKIPYIHCFNHRLHLVVVKAVSDNDSLRDFFDMCMMLHEFFHHPKISSLYEGQTIVRLLPQRWSGHFAITKVVSSNYSEINRVLDQVVTQSTLFNGEDRAKSIGIKTVIETEEFRFCLIFAKKFLGLLHPADAAMQSRTASLKVGLDVVKSVLQQLQVMRTSQKEFELILEDANKLIPMIESTNNTMSKRKIKTSEHPSYITETRLPSYSANHAIDGDLQNSKMKLKQTYNECLDLIINEINRRFSDNQELVTAISRISEFKTDNMNVFKELGLKVPSEEELAVVKNFLIQREAQTDDGTRLEVLFRFREAFLETYELMAAVETFGCSTATCESTFSTLTAINRPQRLSMSHARMADLVYLAFERHRTSALNIDVVLRKFNDRKNRKLALYQVT
ncbi:uncharacterized protein LOC126898050 [Daktulosphaira vitifoliae]|uniref:uncharacterized protein LOC126898050 n=1 Tax=Daktulosphaira vitifoliae TaxID=58002 RepID=UPI0021AA26E4|nr:uncharacterized protein LOC126898050 [Daktulosphaira vitifoliae]